MKLFCLPYAGGSSAIFSPWKKSITHKIEVHPIELAGRGSRYNESLYNNMEDAVDDVYKKISESISNDEAYAIFGHSMGSLIAYELCHKIANQQKKMPQHVFFSGCRAPNIKRQEKVIYNAPIKEFKERLLNMGGTPKEILENKELLELFIPSLRSDFKLVETYKYIHGEKKLPIDITVLNGRKDNITLNEITSWRKHTIKSCSIQMFDGGHFYINDNTKVMLDIIQFNLLGK